MTKTRAGWAEQFIASAREELERLQAAATASWRFGHSERWCVDLDEGTIVFRFSDGVMVTAPIQVVGSYNSDNSTFLWAWDHPYIPVPLRRDALLAKDWGEQNRVANFTSRKVACDEGEAWSFTAVAARLGKASGAYRAPAGGSVPPFMTLGEVQSVSPKN